MERGGLRGIQENCMRRQGLGEGSQGSVRTESGHRYRGQQEGHLYMLQTNGRLGDSVESLQKGTGDLATMDREG